MRGPMSAALEVEDLGDGSYTASYLVNISGDYALSVTLGHQHVAGARPHAGLTAAAGAALVATLHI